MSAIVLLRRGKVIRRGTAGPLLLVQSITKDEPQGGRGKSLAASGSRIEGSVGTGTFNRTFIKEEKKVQGHQYTNVREFSY